MWELLLTSGQRCKPSPTAKIYHIDIDPLKQQMPVFYIDAHARYRADAFTALRQINSRISGSPKLQHIDAASRLKTLEAEHKKRMDEFVELAKPREDGMVSAAYMTKRMREIMPKDAVVLLEAVTQTVAVANQLQCVEPGSIIGSGAGGRKLFFALNSSI
jgi:thiamine pyrophosphate-dependent acetolactate synthase large subunit-like protein